MNQIAVAYGIAGIAVAVAVATVAGTTFGAGPEEAPERQMVLAAAPLGPELGPPAPEQPVLYVDERGNPVPAPQGRGRGGEEDGREDEEHEDEEHEDDEHEDDEREEHERRGRRHG